MRADAAARGVAPSLAPGWSVLFETVRAVDIGALAASVAAGGTGTIGAGFAAGVATRLAACGTGVTRAGEGLPAQGRATNIQPVKTSTATPAPAANGKNAGRA